MTRTYFVSWVDPTSSSMGNVIVVTAAWRRGQELIKHIIKNVTDTVSTTAIVLNIVDLT
jgi:hypothetical protein